VTSKRRLYAYMFSKEALAGKLVNPFSRGGVSRRKRRVWNRKQTLAHDSGARYYGDGGTIHASGQLDICMTPDGTVTQVWFRCQMLPFAVSVSADREPVACESLPVITGVEVRDP
jgi:hypothetical protein